MKKLRVIGVVAVGMAMFGMSGTAHAESSLQPIGPGVLNWELFLDGLDADEVILDLTIECDGQLVDHIQGEHQADASGEYDIQFFAEDDATVEGCSVRVEGVVHNFLVPFPQVPVTGSNTTVTLTLVAVLVGAGLLLLGATRLGRTRMA